MDIHTQDKENLRQVILDFPQQFKTGFALAKKLQLTNIFQAVCVSGMGGSSLPVDVLKTYLKTLRKQNPQANPVFQLLKNRTYTLPPEAYEQCLNVFSSYSGNTEETLSALQEAIKNNLPSIAITHGGKLKEICERNNIPVLIIPKISQPRYALGYFFSILLQILINIQLASDTTTMILESIPTLTKETLRLEKNGQDLAQQLKGFTPIIHTTDQFKSIGRIWKIKINENAKTPAFYNFYSELNHNEMVGFSLPQAKFYIITLIDSQAHPQIRKRMPLTNHLLSEKGLTTTLINIPNNDNIFLALFSSLALGDWVSYYLALGYNQDPTPVNMVEDLKKVLV